MSDTSSIEWTDATWNPLVGCTSVSPGCDNCYARQQVDTRFHPAALAQGGKLLEAFPAPFETVSVRPDRFLLQPLHWREPKRVFVNSLSDLFHADVPDDFIARVFAVMALAGQHTFQLLTKRHGRMRSLLSSEQFAWQVWHAILGLAHDQQLPIPDRVGQLFGHGRTPVRMTPLPNVWLGVSVENQQWADIRIPALLDTPAAVRFLSMEPLLGPVSFRWAKWQPFATEAGGVTDQLDGLRRLDWIVAGGESGPGARPAHPDWFRAVRDQCLAAGVPFFFKQHGAWHSVDQSYCTAADHYVFADGSGSIELAVAHGERRQGTVMRRVGKKAAGRELDGRTWDEFPQAVPARC